MKVNITSSVTLLQVGRAAFNVRVTLPLFISVAVGVYTAFKVVTLGVNVPEPPDQKKLEADTVEPASVIFELLEQMFLSAPALAVGAFG